MAYQEEAPYRPQDAQEIATMLSGLEANKGKAKGKGGFSCKKATFKVDNSRMHVDSWRMQDWDYKKPNLPTYARGLFTMANSKGQQEIVTRGYDKFFNHGEVRETEWRNVENDTRGPYELSVKENGCIIFISGLEDGTLLVCSKHSTGARTDVDVSHATVGDRWVDKHLATVGRTRRQLAERLREMNATAVAELCDDDFEEHVLQYTPETAGLYLHGINLNLPEFATYPHALIDRFADEWGFRKTMHIIKDDIRDVKTFLDAVAETGNYAGRDTEGFVIRCQSKANTGDWHDWFFKYKFEEPYLMYRQWRECTKAVIAGREPRYKKHKKITEDYIAFARKQLRSQPDLAKAYQANHGIIKMRDDFLAFRGLKGSDIIRQEAEEGEVANDEVTGEVILVPVATIGCGKTTVALGLCKLFGWGHIQNDNITVRKNKPLAFASACYRELENHPAMIADRNNHQKRERNQLIEDVTKFSPHVRFVCLHYVHDRSNYNDIRAATRARVLNRGDNHQTIQAGSKGSGEIIEIMEGFMHRFEPVDPTSPPDENFDTIIDLDVLSSSRQNLETVVTRLYQEYPKLFADREMPSSDDMDAAIDAAMRDYTVDIKHEIKPRTDSNPNKHNHSQAHPQSLPSHPNTQSKTPKVEYFAIQLPYARILSLLTTLFPPSADPALASFYHHLQSQRRIQTEFHVTLIHKSSARTHADVWNSLVDLHNKKSAETGESEPVLGLSNVSIERLVWDERIMAFVVRMGPAEGEDEKQRFVSVNEHPHVTVGTADASVKPKESNDLLARWLRVGSGGETGIREVKVPGVVEVEGVVRGVLSKF